MRFTKLRHSCVRLEKDGAALVIDPGVFTDAAGALAGASAVLITHEHPDHIDPDAVRAALSADPGLSVWANATVCGMLSAFGDRVHEVRHGDDLSIAGFSVHVHGTDHALVHKDIPLVRNTGFLVEGEIFHPGDALTVPDEPVRTLLVPCAAPWMKAAEMIDYVRAVGPQRGYAIHEAILSEAGLGVVERLMEVAAKPLGVPASLPEPGTTLEL